MSIVSVFGELQYVPNSVLDYYDDYAYPLGVVVIADNRKRGGI
jgi:hypothetical protein